LVTLEATLAAATFPTRFEELRFEIPEPFEATRNPATVRPVRVPTDVMLTCAGFVTLEATLAAATFPTRFEELRFAIPEPSEATSNPFTVKPVRVPTDVMLTCAGFVTLEATLAAATFPIRFEELRFEIPEPFEATRNPFTVKPDKVPTDVMFPWAGLVTLEATSAETTLPTMFEELKLYRPDALPMYRLAMTELRFEIPKTLRVDDPKTVAEFTYRVETFRVSVMFADPRTYRLEPSGGGLRVPTETPFW
jgi:hypothetical protein